MDILELIFQDSNSVGFVSIAGIALFFFCLFLPDNNDSSALLQNQILPYNSTYPFTAARKEGNYKIFKIAVIADPDKSSRRDGKDTYYSELLHGTLRFNENKPEIDFYSKSIPLKSGYSLSGRGMELSDLTVYNGHLLTVDDRTGIVYQISDKSKMFPWQILADGNGLNEKGFKAEWMTVKDNYLFVGGMGKEYVLADGSIPHRNPEYVKEISPKGEVRHLNWISKYDAIRRAAGYEYPAYLLHESCNWSSHLKQWFFLPRRASDLPYDEVLDENRCGNILIRADEDFKNIKITKILETTLLLQQKPKRILTLNK